MNDKYYIAAPFGNYIHRSGISSIMGTFSLKQRKGLLLQLYDKPYKLNAFANPMRGHEKFLQMIDNTPCTVQ